MKSRNPKYEKFLLTGTKLLPLHPKAIYPLAPWLTSLRYPLRSYRTDKFVLIVGATILYNSLAKDYKPNNVVVLSSSQKETSSTEASSEVTTSKETSTTSEKTASKVKPSSEPITVAPPTPRAVSQTRYILSAPFLYYEDNITIDTVCQRGQ